MSARAELDLGVYLVTDPVLCGDRGVAAVVAEAVAGGVGVVQLRDKHASDAEIVEQLAELADVIDGRATLLVNDRLEAAVEARRRGIRVDGVHLGQGDPAVERARGLLGADAVVGLTANTAAHLAALARLPRGIVDYLGVGAIRPTTTKADHPPAVGIAGFARFAAHAELPCVAIGGIRVTDVAALRDTGAAGVAVVSAICAAADPRAAAAEFVRAFAGRGATTPVGRGATKERIETTSPGLDTAPGRHDPREGGIPRVLSIAGSDPSGGAGIQADLKSISAVGGYGMAAITALTAQNTRGVRDVHVPPAAFLTAQLDALADDLAIDAVKLGMLANADVIRAVGDWLRRTRPPVVVLDPVMVSTSGHRLLDADAEQALRELLPLADLVTPNLAELAVLAGESPATDWAGVVAQAETVSAGFGVRVLAKGGHLGGDTAPDALVDAASATIVEFGGDRIATTSTHGTGCSLSSAIATLRVSRGDWEPAVAQARRWLRESIRHGGDLAVGGGHGPVHHFAGLWSRGGLVTAPTPAEVEAEWWAAIADVRAAIDGLPFIRALADGSLAAEPFRRYIEQDALYLRDYARVLAEAARLAPDSAAQGFWADSAHGCIVGELELHELRLAEASASPAGSAPSGSSPRHPDATTTAYLDHLLAAGARGEYAVLVAAVLPCFWLYTDLGERLAEGAFGEFARDPGHPYASWLATYADPAFAIATRRAIEIVTEAAAAASADVRERMLRAFRRSAEHELAFFGAPLGAQVPAGGAPNAARTVEGAMTA
ncbi:bifunctional hydroxymethylpyrimidine kinase/phosphomethylpyrimidine kinase [Agromyces sp. CFH 90414]|uniref:Thiamine-phosphate synthase n=1 Tax=Agromyces agglutinans TaxID=2662258 RepID=A0A6I2F323_9MICO|nr:bifunctional hydroxymethylpyrimidine kinase/phosphomethylpyrimidine kinase [Agromyces agglutinans]MRG59935.1 bifunctional hydroxymethylpyrimidine kinase/phosphomethylpyrimidine kinase [Agromyces agglutinans]